MLLIGQLHFNFAKSKLHNLFFMYFFFLREGEFNPIIKEKSELLYTTHYARKG